MDLLRSHVREDDANRKDEGVRFFGQALANGSKLDAGEGEDVLAEGGGEFTIGGLILDCIRSDWERRCFVS